MTTAGLLKGGNGGRSRSASVSSPLFNSQHLQNQQVPFPGQQQEQQSQQLPQQQQQQKRQQQQPIIRQRSLSTLTNDERLQIQSVENFLKLEDDLLATVEELPLNFLKRQLIRNLICSLFKFFKSKVGTGDDDGTRLIDIDDALLYNDIQVVVNNLISVIYTMDESGAAVGGIPQGSNKSRNVGSRGNHKTLNKASTAPSTAIGLSGRSTRTRNQQQNERDDDNDDIDDSGKDTVAAGEFDDAENEIALLGNRFSRLFDNRSSVGTRSRSRSFKSYTSGINTPYRYHTPGPNTAGVGVGGGVGVAHSVSHSHAPSLAQSMYSIPGVSSPEPFYQQQTPHLQYQQQQQQQQHMMQQQLTGTGSLRFDLQPLPQQPPPPQTQQQLLAQHQAAYLPTPTAQRGMQPPPPSQPQGGSQLMASTSVGLYSETSAMLQPQHLVFKNVTGGSQVPKGSPNPNAFVYGGPGGSGGVAGGVSGTLVSGPYGNPRYSVSQLSVNPYVDVYYQ
ncbi:unnamed protein product [Ambrosiozyma monospora]|uniref:Unnamed protein product n=1 Tax=Ambrosiozyma monospora TaxID=43982 RepID=A0A9W6Z077_AMBMO|nr:unnamed protein product [Ambrosiozyma monospora]